MLHCTIGLETPWVALFSPADSLKMAGAPYIAIDENDQENENVVTASDERTAKVSAELAHFVKFYTPHPNGLESGEPFVLDHGIAALCYDRLSLISSNPKRTQFVRVSPMSPNPIHRNVELEVNGQKVKVPGIIVPVAPPMYGGMTPNVLLPYGPRGALALSQSEPMVRAAMQRIGSFVLLGNERLVGVARVIHPGLCEQDANREALPIYKNNQNDLKAAVIDGNCKTFSNDDYARCAIVGFEVCLVSFFLCGDCFFSFSFLLLFFCFSFAFLCGGVAAAEW